MRVTASLKDNLPNKDLVQEHPPAFQPNSPETSSRFGAVCDGEKRANLDRMDSKLCLHYFLPKELVEEISEYEENEEIEAPTELGSTDL